MKKGVRAGFSVTFNVLRLCLGMEETGISPGECAARMCFRYEVSSLLNPVLLSLSVVMAPISRDQTV